MRFFLTLAALTCFVLTGFGQTKKLTLEDAVLRQRTTLAPARLVQLQWVANTSACSWIQTEEKEEWLVRTEVSDTATKKVLSLSMLNAALKAAKADTLSRFPLMKWSDPGSFAFDQGKKSWVYRVDSAVLTLRDSSTLPESAEHAEKSTDDKIAYVNDGNIFIEMNHRAQQITRDGSKDIVYGTTVHREEFGIDKGLFWSPKSDKLAFYRMDQSMVTPYPILDFSGVPAKNEDIRYPFAGAKSHQVTVGIYDVLKGSTLYLKTGEPLEQYLTNVAWSPDGRFVYIAVVNRAQDRMDLRVYDAVSGEYIRTLFTESDERYTEPLHPVVFVPGKEGHFVWQSRRDGWNHLYLYGKDGKLIRQLTRGAFEVTDFNGFDAAGKSAYFHATANTGIDRIFCSVELSTAKFNRLTMDQGVHQCILSTDKKYFIDTYSHLKLPRVTRLMTSTGKPLRTLLTATNPLKDFTAGDTRLFSIKAEDSTDLWCRMILPADFDSSRKYPVIVYVYGGPHAQMVTNSWLAGADLWFHYLTQQGYIVFTLDNRGSAWRGKKFEQATFRNLGDVEMKDQITGVNYLRTLTFIDANRLGVNGWSFGGFMTTSLMSRYPGIFKAGVAGGPVIDWSAYEVMYTERYMDTPEENPGGYTLNNLLNHVEQLNGRLMLIHGTSDDVVVWQHSIMYLKKAVSKGVQLDYFVYPGHPHNVSGKDRVHLNEKITRYFNDFLRDR